MKLTLDHTQRLNLVAILDGLECSGRREAHAVCKLQDMIDLDDEEKKSINYKRDRAADGREFVMWSNNGHIKPIEFNFGEGDSARLIKAIDNHRVILARDRNWYLPLMEQLPEMDRLPEEEKNVPRT